MKGLVLLALAVLSYSTSVFAEFESSYLLGVQLSRLNSSENRLSSLSEFSEASGFTDIKTEFSKNLYRFKLEFGALSAHQLNVTNSGQWLSELSIGFDKDNSTYDFGIISKNLSHIEQVSLTNRSQSRFIHSPQFTRPQGSLGLGYKKFLSSSQLELIAQFKQSAYGFSHGGGSLWLPDNRITNLNFGGRVLILPENPNLYFLDNRELENALSNSLSLKYTHNLSSSDLGVYYYRGPSAPSFFYKFVAQFTNADQSEINVGPDVGIIPTYYTEEAIVHFGTYQFDSSILRWELGNVRSLSDFSVISLDTNINETTLQLQWEKAQYLGSHSLMHFFILSHTEASSPVNYKLTPSNFIYYLRYSGDSPWSGNILLNKSMLFSSSWVGQLALNFEITDRSELKFFYTEYKSSDIDLVNMYNQKSNFSVELSYLF